MRTSRPVARRRREPPGRAGAPCAGGRKAIARNDPANPRRRCARCARRPPPAGSWKIGSPARVTAGWGSSRWPWPPPRRSTAVGWCPPRTPFDLRRGRRGRLPDHARRPRPPCRRADHRDAAQRLRQQGPVDHRRPPERPSPSLLRTTMREVHLRRTGRDLLSRTADNLFWLGRYGERAEGTMRAAAQRAVAVSRRGRPDSNPSSSQRLLRLQLRAGPARRPRSDGCRRLGRGRAAGRHPDARPARAYGLRDSLDQLHRTATLVRDQISHDAWRMLNALHIDRRWRQGRIGRAWPGRCSSCSTRASGRSTRSAAPKPRT